MPYFEVTYEARNSGAQGSYWPYTQRICCVSAARAIEIAFENAHRSEKLETRFPISIIEKGTFCICGTWDPTPTNPDTPEDWCPIHGIGGKPATPDKVLNWREVCNQ